MKKCKVSPFGLHRQLARETDCALARSTGTKRRGFELKPPDLYAQTTDKSWCLRRNSDAEDEIIFSNQSLLIITGRYD